MKEHYWCRKKKGLIMIREYKPKAEKSKNRNDIEWLHDNGKMPDRYYYQMNGKDPIENFMEQRRKIYKELGLLNQDDGDDTVNFTCEVNIKK